MVVRVFVADRRVGRRLVPQPLAAIRSVGREEEIMTKEARWQRS
jgi:hypothetical protein